MRRTKLPLRGTPAHARARTTAKKPRTQPPKSARGQSIADRETRLRAEASRDPESLLLRIRRSFDADILEGKRTLVARGLRETHVVAAVVNPRLPVFPGWIGMKIEFLARAELLALDHFPEGEAGAEFQAELRRPPKEGHVWVWIPIPKRRLLTEEPVDYRVPDPELGSVAETGGEA